MQQLHHGAYTVMAALAAADEPRQSFLGFDQPRKWWGIADIPGGPIHPDGLATVTPGAFGYHRQPLSGTNGVVPSAAAADEPRRLFPAFAGYESWWGTSPGSPDPSQPVRSVYGCFGGGGGMRGMVPRPACGHSSGTFVRRHCPASERLSHTPSGHWGGVGGGGAVVAAAPGRTLGVRADAFQERLQPSNHCSSTAAAGHVQAHRLQADADAAPEEASAGGSDWSGGGSAGSEGWPRR